MAQTPPGAQGAPPPGPGPTPGHPPTQQPGGLDLSGLTKLMQMLGGKAQGALGTAEQAQQGLDKNIGAGEDAMKAKIMEFLKGIMSKAGAGAEGAVTGPASPFQGATNALDGKPQPPGLSPQ